MLAVDEVVEYEVGVHILEEVTAADDRDWGRHCQETIDAADSGVLSPTV